MDLSELSLEFACANGEIQLERTIFRMATGEEFMTVRGKTPGAYIRAGSFQWTPAVKAVCIMFTKALARFLGNEPALEPLISGNRGSLASSLDFAIDKEPQWLCDMFGLDSSGKTNLRRLVFRTNPGLKRPGPVSINVNETALAPENIKVMVDSIPVHEVQFLNSIIGNISTEVHDHLKSSSFESVVSKAQLNRLEIWERKLATTTFVPKEDVPRIIPADDSDIEDIFQYEEQEFPGHHATKNRLREWRDHDPSNFMCIKMPNEPVIGYYILFFLKPESMQRFLAGDLLEDDIRASDLIPPKAKNYAQQADAHICSFVSKKQGWLFTVDLLWHMFGRIVDLGQHGYLSRVYAEPTTPEGERVLKGLQFEPFLNSKYRSEALFQLSLSPAKFSQWQQWYKYRSFSMPSAPSLIKQA